MVGLAGHDPVDRRHQLAANRLDQPGEILIAAQRIVRDMDAPEMIGDAARAHRVEFRLYRGVGAGCDDPNFIRQPSASTIAAAPVQMIRARHSPKPMGTQPAFWQWARKITSSPSSTKVRVSPEAKVIERVPSLLNSMRLP